MKLRLLPGLFLLRRLIRELVGIREQLALQTALTTRLANHLAPQPPAVDRQAVATDTGVDYVDPIDQTLIQSYSERMARDTGHVPTDDELLSYLADEKTVDLHSRLLARDREAERLAAERTR